MPVATIIFDDGTVTRLHVTSFSTENDVNLDEAMDGSRTRPRRGGLTMSITGLVASFDEQVAAAQLTRSAGIDSRTATLQAGYNGRSGETHEPVMVEPDQLLWRRINAMVGRERMPAGLMSATGADLDAFAADYGLTRFRSDDPSVRVTFRSTHSKPKPKKEPALKRQLDALRGPPVKSALDQILEDDMEEAV